MPLIVVMTGLGAAFIFLQRPSRWPLSVRSRAVARLHLAVGSLGLTIGGLVLLAALLDLLRSAGTAPGVGPRLTTGLLLLLANTLVLWLRPKLYQ